MPSSEKTTKAQAPAQQQKPKESFFKQEDVFSKKPGEGFFDKPKSPLHGASQSPFFAPPVKPPKTEPAGKESKETTTDKSTVAPEKTSLPPTPVVKEEEQKKDITPDPKTTETGDKAITGTEKHPVANAAQVTAAPAKPVVAPAAPVVKTVTPAVKETEKDAEQPITAETPEKTTEAGDTGSDANTGGDTPDATATDAPDTAATPAATDTQAGTDKPAETQEAVAETTGETAPAAEQTPAEPPAPSTPGEDPEYQKLVGGVQTTATKESQHPKAGTAAAAINKAASGGTNEVSSRAQGNQVGKISQQKAKPFDRKAFVDALMKKIEEITPKNLKEADEFKENDKAATLKPALNKQVGDGKAKSQGEIKNTAQQQPSTDGVKAKKVEPLKPLRPGAKPSLDGKAAAPKPRTETEINQPANEASQELDDAYKKEDVTSEQLQTSNEPDFVAADNAKKDSQDEIKKSPGAYRQDEQTMLKTAGTEMHGFVNTGLGGMHGSRTGSFGKVNDRQTKGKDQNEGKRKEINDKLQDIYGKTKKDIDTTLKNLDTTVNQKFDKGEATARAIFEIYVDQRMTAYKAQRYAGAMGKLRWAKDWLFDMPDYVNTFYEEGKKKYTNHMNTVLNDIAVVVENTLTKATERVALGKDEIKKYLDSLDPATRKIADQEAGKILDSFEKLQDSINEKQTQLIEGLAQKYVAKMGELNERIKALKEANKGWVTKALALIDGVIKKIIELKNMLFSVLKKAMKVIGAIIAHPIDFFSNLATAVGDGISNFMKNIGEHLKRGFLSWLLGNLPPGVELPQSLDLKDIFKFTMQVLGFTWANIRAKAVARLGERVVKALEGVSDKAFDIFKILAKGGGLAEIWEYIKEQIGNLKEMVLDSIESFLTDMIIKKGIEFIIGLLNPVGAFIKACEAIYSFVKFIIERAQQILDFINSVLDSIDLISQGSLAPAAKKVEESLAKAIPVTLGFLASLLGLSGLTDKVIEILEKVRKPFMKAIDWLVEKAVTYAQKAFSKLMGKEEKKQAKEEVDEKDDHKSNDAAKTGDELLDRLTAYRVKINVDGGHTLKFEGDLTNNVLAVYSTRTNLNDLLRQKQEEIYAHKDDANYQQKQNALSAINVKKKEFGGALGKYRAKQKEKYSANVTPEYEVMKAALDDIGRNLEIIGVNLEHTTLVPTFVAHTTSNGKASNVTAEPLTKIPGNTRGSSPSDAPAGWEKIEPDDRSKNWVRAHMLNHQLHGPGVAWNLFPARKTINAQMEADVESKAKRAIQSDNAYYYEVNLSYSGEFPNHVSMEFGEYDITSKTRKGTPLIKGYDLEAPQVYTVHINTESAARLNEVAKINGKTGLSGYFDKLVAERNRNGEYDGLSDIETRLSPFFSNPNDFKNKHEKLVDLVRTRKIDIS